MSNRLVDPKKKLQDSRLKIDDFTNRLSRLFLMRLQQYRERLAWRNDILYANNPLNHITKHNKKLEQICNSKKIEKFFQEKITFKDLQKNITKDLKIFYTKSENFFLYTPFPLAHRS